MTEIRIRKYRCSRMNDGNIVIIALVGLLVLVFALPFLLRFAQFLNDFTQELKYLNVEIRRTSGKERKYWIRRRRKLWLSLIPFL